MTVTDLATDLAQLTGDYTVDPIHSRIGFMARHAMVSKVRGAFNDFEANLHIDAAEPSRSSVRVVIQVASIDTRNSDRDAHLRNDDFLAADEYPTIVFESTSTDRVDGDTYRVSGDLSIRGVTKPVTIEFDFLGAARDPWGNLRLGFEGDLVVNRKDWGVNFNAALEAGGVLISEKVTLEFELALVKTATV